jgi:hypothetical protein
MKVLIPVGLLAPYVTKGTLSTMLRVTSSISV